MFLPQSGSTIFQVRHKDEYIAELEARLEREVTEVAQVFEQNCSCMISCRDLVLEIQLNPS